MKTYNGGIILMDAANIQEVAISSHLQYIQV